MAKTDTPNWTMFAHQIIEALADTIFNEDSEHHINMEEDELTDFIHAMATVAPSDIYRKITGDQVDNLGFNHIANRLCVQYRTEKNVVEKTTDDMENGMIVDKSKE